MRKQMKMNTIPGTIKNEIETYTEPVDILICFLATGVLLFLSFVGHSTLNTTYIHIPMGVGVDAQISITYYGFPLPMIGILTPVGSQQASAALWYQILGYSSVQILWTGLLFNIAIFFLISFLAIFMYRRYLQH